MDNTIIDILPIIRSYRGGSLSLISKRWRDRLRDHNEYILSLLQKKYPSTDIHSSMRLAILSDDIEIVKSIIHEYSSYLPINWNLLYRIGSDKMRIIIKHKRKYIHNQCNSLWYRMGFEELPEDIPLSDFKNIVDTVDLNIQYTEYTPINTLNYNIRYIFDAILYHKRYNLADHLYIKYISHMTEILRAKTSTALYLNSKGYRHSPLYTESIIKDDPTIYTWDNHQFQYYLGDVLKYDAIKIFTSLYRSHNRSAAIERCIANVIHDKILDYMLISDRLETLQILSSGVRNQNDISGTLLTLNIIDKDEISLLLDIAIINSYLNIIEKYRSYICIDVYNIATLSNNPYTNEYFIINKI